MSRHVTSERCDLAKPSSTSTQPKSFRFLKKRGVPAEVLHPTKLPPAHQKPWSKVSSPAQQIARMALPLGQLWSMLRHRKASRNDQDRKAMYT